MKFISKLLPASKTKLVISVVAVLVLAMVSGIFTYQLTKAEVTMTNNGEVTSVQTHADTVGDLLNELKIEVKEHDQLSHAKEEAIKSGMEINYKKAKHVVVSINGKETDYYTTADTVENFLSEEGIRFGEHDEVTLDLGAKVKDGLTIGVKKAYQVTLKDGTEEKQVWTTGGTVGDLLDSENITLDELDRLEPKRSKRLSKDTEVVVTRVEKVTDVVEETKDYAVVTRSDSSLAKGTQKVISSGEEGVVAKHYEVILENGKEVSRELIKEEVKKESVKRVVAVGTKVNQNSGSNTVSRGDDQVVKTLYMEATAYNWDCRTCSGSGLTYTGYNLKANPHGTIAVDPNVIPLGTKVWVEGYGYAIARDTGGNIKGNRIDVHLPTLSQAINYGRKNVQVKILK